MSIGDNIRNIRKQKGLTQAELGKRLGCTQQTIALYESSGDSLHVTTVKKVAAALHVDVAELLVDTASVASPFHRYLESIGYVVSYDNGLELQTGNSAVQLSNGDIKLLEDLEVSVRTDIQRTLDLLIATKN